MSIEEFILSLNDYQALYLYNVLASNGYTDESGVFHCTLTDLMDVLENIVDMGF